MAAAALACAAVSLGHPSLEVFSRTQTGAPQWPGATQGDSRIRWLASSSGWDIYGLITEGGNICLTSFDAGASGGGSCTSRSEFEQSGLALGTSRVTDVGTTYLSIRWGPLGGARVYPVPLDQAPTS